MLQTTRQTQQENVQSRFQFNIPANWSHASKQLASSLLRSAHQDITALKNNPDSEAYGMFLDNLIFTCQCLHTTAQHEATMKEIYRMQQDAKRLGARIRYLEAKAEETYAALIQADPNNPMCWCA